ncbi:MAG TPA: nucleotidyltransferase family protein [Candidatus Paceibacterota bacterium]
MTISEIKEKTKAILLRRGITRAGVFGSVARGEDTAKSDVDMLVEIPHAHGLFEFLSIKHELENALQKKVDLVEYMGIKKLLRENILKSEVPIL